MFARNASPIGNIPVYKRIAINERSPGDPNTGPTTWTELAWENHRAIVRQAHAARIWQAVVDTATGTNAPAVTPSEYQAPREDAA